MPHLWEAVALCMCTGIDVYRDLRIYFISPRELWRLGTVCFYFALRTLIEPPNVNVVGNCVYAIQSSGTGLIQNASPAQPYEHFE